MVLVSDVFVLAQSMLPSVVAGGLGVFLKSTSVCNETDAFVRTFWAFVRPSGALPAQLYTYKTQPLRSRPSHSFHCAI
jgi:hypothetical protein